VVATGTRQSCEVEMLRADGGTFAAHLESLPYGGEQLRIVMTDITARRAAEEMLRKRTAQLETANRELESFAYSISHDLRAPLRAIDGFTRMLLKKHGEFFDEESRRKFEVIRDQSRTMDRLIDDLLAFSRLGTQEIAKTDLDMFVLAREAWEKVLDANPGRELHLTVRDLAPGQGDRTLLRQVFHNLLENAVKFTRGRAVAEIETGSYEDDNSTVYYVRDNGAGFDMAYAHKLFGVFQRLHGQEYPGTGAGLAIVKRIVQRHG